LKTTDGGVNWLERPLPDGYTTWSSLNTVEFIDANTGWIGFSITAQDKGEIFKTTDGGDTWTLQYSGFEENVAASHKENYTLDRGAGIRSIFFKDSNIGYAVNGSGQGWCRSILTTTNGGSNWIEKYDRLEETGLLSVYVNSKGEGWAVGFSGVIFITEDNGSSWAQILSGSNSVSLWSGDFIYSIYFINDSVGWAVGKRNQQWQTEGTLILRTTNGGKIWKTQFHQYGSNIVLSSVYFINEDIGWATGEQGVEQGWVFRTTDGGENWIGMGVSPFKSVFFINENTGWATSPSYSQGIYKATDGGITWVEKSSISCSSVYFSDINNGWAVGKGGSILKSTDGSETWFAETSGTTNDLNCVKFYDSNIGMCVGNGGTVLLSTDGGISWIPQPVSTTEALSAVGFANLNTVWIAGSNGTILNTTDLGYNWTSYNEVTENDLTSLHFINENTGWMSGLNGSLFKYQNDVVPVELVSFTVYIKNNTVHLNWETATEVNNFGFEILRQAQDDRWDLLGFIAGNGNSISPKSYSFTDSPLGGSKFKYRLKQVDNDGKYEYSNEIEVEIVPSEFALYQNYPNPFNPTTKIRYQLPKESKVVIKIYDILGTEIITLLNEKKDPGVYEVELNAQSLSSGMYIYSIIAGEPSTGSEQGFVENKKMILQK
jgi:photosystem II stability/assembly factor-like uncharacterized protein